MLQSSYKSLAKMWRSGKGPSIKDVRSQWGGVCPVRTREVLQMWMSTLFGGKNLGFFKIYGVSVRTRRKRG